MTPPRRQRTAAVALPEHRHLVRDPLGIDRSTRDSPDAYVLDVREAKLLLRSTSRIDAPIFIANGAVTGFVDLENDDRRPIEQVLDWLPDLAEQHNLSDKEAPRASVAASKQVTVSEIKERFINQQQHRPFPWNFPEIPFPMPAPDRPDFLRHPSCNLLNDLIRYVQDVNIEQICPATCKSHGVTADRCPTHFQTADEIVEFRRAAQHWHGTIMMAEAGAYTGPHHDTPGFGTFISCYEGEIGFACQTTAPNQRSKACCKTQSSDKWFYRVLRPGDAVYMGPGTKHLVFRQPYGKQTLATAVRVLRYCDVVRWLQTLNDEFDSEDDDPVYFSRVVRALVMGIRHYIDQAQAQNALEKFGGSRNVNEAERLLCVIDRKLHKLWKAL